MFAHGKIAFFTPFEHIIHVCHCVSTIQNIVTVVTEYEIAHWTKVRKRQ